MTPTAGTRLFALLGDPVSHSLSPRFQNAAFRALELDAVFVALRCGADELPGLLRGIAHAGGGGNVTVPHKALAARTVDRPSDAVLRTGACNAYWLEDGAVHGDNTDVAGASAAIATLLGRQPAGARVLLLGAGGAASAAVCALADAGAERIVIANRTPGRARALADRFRAPDVRIDAARVDGLAGERFDLAINSTSLGLKPADPLPLDPHAAGVTIGAALDLVYSPRETNWVHEMRARGIPADDGKEMLIQQGAAAFRRWWRMDPPLEVMREALAHASAGGTWTPTSRAGLLERVNRDLAECTDEQRAYFGRVSLAPEKWSLRPWGNLGGGFWVVAVDEDRVLWYNDIEDGFNVSQFVRCGQIPEDQYWCNQRSLGEALPALRHGPVVQLNPPQPLRGF